MHHIMQGETTTLLLYAINSANQFWLKQVGTAIVAATKQLHNLLPMLNSNPRSLLLY
jgi:hypothetical protein